MKFICPGCGKNATYTIVTSHGPHDGYFQSVIGPRTDYNTVKCNQCQRTFTLDFGKGDR
jgi:hypothetical protein